jgi:hypothetical protein
MPNQKEGVCISSNKNSCSKINNKPLFLYHAREFSRYQPPSKASIQPSANNFQSTVPINAFLNHMPPEATKISINPKYKNDIKISLKSSQQIEPKKHQPHFSVESFVAVNEDYHKNRSRVSRGHFQNENGQPTVIPATVVIKEKKKQIEPIVTPEAQPTSKTSLIAGLKPPSFSTLTSSPAKPAGIVPVNFNFNFQKK